MRGRLGAVAVLVLGAMAGWQGARAYSVQPAPGRRAAQPAGGDGRLIALPLDSGASRHVVLIDPVRRVVAVYQVDPTTGALTLKSVRNVAWDFQLHDYNGTRPSPDEIRNLIEQPRP